MIYIIISFIVNIIIMPIGSSTAGENYTLQCSINGTNEPATFQWLKGSLNNKLMMTPGMSIIINSNSSITQLQFQPLHQQSHNGSYCCNATIDIDGTRQSKCLNVTVKGT